MIHVVQDHRSKQIGAEPSASGTTVKVHRSNLMRKMRAGSLPELGRVADELKLGLEKP